MKQTIDTARVAASANKLRAVNSNINRQFQSFRGIARRIEGNWNSRAGSTAVTQLYQLLQGNQARSDILQNYINMLAQQVDPGYEGAEAANTSLADQFK